MMTARSWHRSRNPYKYYLFSARILYLWKTTFTHLICFSAEWLTMSVEWRRQLYNSILFRGFVSTTRTDLEFNAFSGLNIHSVSFSLFDLNFFFQSYVSFFFIKVDEHARITKYFTWNFP